MSSLAVEICLVGDQLNYFIGMDLLSIHNMFSLCNKISKMYSYLEECAKSYQKTSLNFTCNSGNASQCLF